MILALAVRAAPSLTALLPRDGELPPGFPTEMLTDVPSEPAAFPDPGTVGGFDPMTPLDTSPPWWWVLGAAIVGLGALVIVGTIVVRGIRYAAATPVTTRARCVAKRTHVSGGGTSTSSSTWYYVTLQLPDGSRRELTCSGRTYGLVAEGDEGLATTRADVLKDFYRDRAAPAPVTTPDPVRPAPSTPAPATPSAATPTTPTAGPVIAPPLY